MSPSTRKRHTWSSIPVGSTSSQVREEVSSRRPRQVTLPAASVSRRRVRSGSQPGVPVAFDGISHSAVCVPIASRSHGSQQMSRTSCLSDGSFGSWTWAG